MEQNLYPHIESSDFNKKITLKKEFQNTKIKGYTKEDYKNITKISDDLCNVKDFELSNHQQFVRNFLSFETPYNSLLLYHGLGTGKTCSSISITEETRKYMKLMGHTKKIIVIASPVVQENYKLQLFDERKLKLVDGYWNIKSCTGNKFIEEVNPMFTKNVSREKVVKQINKIIKNWYQFMGYLEFSNYITSIIKKANISLTDKELKDKNKIDIIEKEFSNRVIVIDEVHNIRTGDKMKRTSEHFLNLVKYAKDTKLILLTATPMYNDHKEIIWLLNLMNLNDGRYMLKEKDIFDKYGDLKVDKNGREIGKETLIKKSTGYFSYVKGNNPFSFPFHIMPEVANRSESLQLLTKSNTWNYPTSQINGLKIDIPIQYLDLFINNISGTIQEKAYNLLIKRLKKDNPILNKKNKGVQYTIIDGPLQLLNMVYPNKALIDDKKTTSPGVIDKMYGREGLLRLMKRDDNKRGYEYKQSTIDNYGRIFSEEKIKTYSRKIHNIINEIKKSTGVVMIYSQFIEGGCVPIALALEELGLIRSTKKNLFKTPPKKRFKFMNNRNKAFFGTYAMITGDPTISPNNKIELKNATNENNKYGEMVKVVIISKAGSEGLDFKNIRQMHLMEPWYNLNRTNQIIGRGVRNLSHCMLPFSERNVEIFLYGTQLNDKNDVEAIDLYMYRLAEQKAMKINEISQILKENALDCVLNKNQLVGYDKNVKINLSSGITISDFNVRAKDYSFACEVGKCNYTCNLNKDPSFKDTEVDTSTYNDYFIILNLDILLKKIKFIFSNGYIFHKKQLFLLINQYKKYSDEEIYIALDILLNNKNEYLKDMLNRPGKLVNIGEYYMFQPLELYNKNISLIQRKTPIEFENSKISLNIPKAIYNKKTNDNSILDSIISNYNYLNGKIKVLNTPNKLEIKKYNSVIQAIHKNIGIDIELLSVYTIHHLIEELPYISKKRILLNYNQVEDKKIKKILTDYFDKYYIGKVENSKVIALPNEKASIRKYNFFVEQDNNVWLEDVKRMSMLTKKLIETFKVTNWQDKWLLKDAKEKTIHFYDIFRDRIVSKIKELGLKTNSSGKQCSIGQNKKTILSKMKTLENNIKEKLNKKEANTKITSLKNMCIAITLYSYYLTYKHNEKYNYNLLEGFLYDVSLLPKIDKNKQDKEGNTLFLV
jgi:superfamily II DNA or RNA helicase